MCTRYYVELSPELRPIIEEARQAALTRNMIHNLGKPLKTEGEIRPTDMVPVIAPGRTGARSTFPMVWGFHVEGLRQPIVNARIESARNKVTFKESFERRRCVIPASYYFEWSHVSEGGKVRPKDKYAIQPNGLSTTYLAGLYRIEEGSMGFKYPVFTILTREAAPELMRIHNRMPVILAAGDIERWIRPGKVDENIRALNDMVAEKVTGQN